MKKRLAAAFAAVLLLCAPCAGALARTYTAAGLFSITYDETVYTLDDVTYRDDSGAGLRWLFILYSDQITIDVNFEQWVSYAGLNLQTADAAQRQAYVADVLDTFADENATYQETIAAGEAGVPFYVFRLEEEEGPCLMAETVVNGCTIDFFAYSDNAALEADSALLDALRALLATYAMETAAHTAA